jgi:hypothetical protein
VVAGWREGVLWSGMGDRSLAVVREGARFGIYGGCGWGGTNPQEIRALTRLELLDLIGKAIAALGPLTVAERGAIAAKLAAGVPYAFDHAFDL